jgi:hypothetical protein
MSAIKIIMLFIICAAVGIILACVHREFGGLAAWIVTICGGALLIALLDKREAQL